MPVATWFIFGLDLVSKRSEGIIVMKTHVNLVVRRSQAEAWQKLSCTSSWLLAVFPQINRIFAQKHSVYSDYHMLHINVLHCLHKVYQLSFTKLTPLSGLNNGILLLPCLVCFLPWTVSFFSRQPHTHFHRRCWQETFFKTLLHFTRPSVCYGAVICAKFSSTKAVSQLLS